MQMDEGLDTGDVLCCEKIAIDPEETSGQLFDRVTAVGARVLCEVVPAIAAGTLKPQPQDHENACLAPMLNKEMAEFRLTESAAHIHNWVRGMNPWPGAWFVTSGGKKLKVMECRAVGKGHFLDRGCGKHLLAANRLVPPGVHRADVMPGGIQCFEALCGNIRRAHEQNAHYLFPFASRAAFLPSSVSS